MPESFYPEVITSLPELDSKVDGLSGWLLQGADRQFVFFEIEPHAVVTAHKHLAQWGVLLEGEMELTIDGQAKVYRKGDYYLIPAGAEHSARFLTRVKVIELFEDADRHKVK